MLDTLAVVGCLRPSRPRSTRLLGPTWRSTRGKTALGRRINLYPLGKPQRNFAVRSNVLDRSYGWHEHALFGINHSGTKTNWFRQSAGGTLDGWTFDGLFFGVEADAAAYDDYGLYSAPTTANNPTKLKVVTAASQTKVFKAPPFAWAGAPSNDAGTGTPCWVDVEITQIGNVVTLTMNRIPIMSYENTTPFTSGSLMLGMCDPWDSVGDNGGVIYDNLRIIQLPRTSPRTSRICGNWTFHGELRDDRELRCKSQHGNGPTPTSRPSPVPISRQWRFGATVLPHKGDNRFSQKGSVDMPVSFAPSQRSAAGRFSTYYRLELRGEVSHERRAAVSAADSDPTPESFGLLR